MLVWNARSAWPTVDVAVICNRFAEMFTCRMPWLRR